MHLMLFNNPRSVFLCMPFSDEGQGDEQEGRVEELIVPESICYALALAAYLMDLQKASNAAPDQKGRALGYDDATYQGDIAACVV